MPQGKYLLSGFSCPLKNQLGGCKWAPSYFNPWSSMAHVKMVLIIMQTAKAQASLRIKTAQSHQNLHCLLIQYMEIGIQKSYISDPIKWLHVCIWRILNCVMLRFLFSWEGSFVLSDLGCQVSEMHLHEILGHKRYPRMRMSSTRMWYISHGIDVQLNTEACCKQIVCIAKSVFLVKYW